MNRKYTVTARTLTNSLITFSVISDSPEHAKEIAEKTIDNDDNGLLGAMIVQLNEA